MLNTDRLCRGCMTDNGGEQICSICGYDSANLNNSSCLPKDFWLQDRFLVGSVVEKNSEGIIYIGWDNFNDTAVHIKEYFPADIAARNPDLTVAVAEGGKFLFNDGLMDFLSLSRSLSSEELSAVIPTRAVFEENGTAYSVMPVISGITLEDFLRKNGGSLKWEQARPLFLPLIDTLSELHRRGIRHYGISPDTIVVGRDGKLRLSGFSINKMRDSASGFEPMLYSGFSAAEQYGIAELSMGEYTDVYALAATLFRVLIGTVPPKAVDRLSSDSLSVPSHFAEELPRQVLVALANGMQTQPSGRTPSVESFKNELVYGETAESERIAASKVAAAKQNTVSKKKKKKGSGAKAGIIAAVCTVLVFAIIGGLVVKMLVDNENKNKVERPDNSSAESMPDTPDVGDVDSSIAQTVTKIKIQSYLGKLYSEVIDSDSTKHLKFSVTGREHSDKYERGTIIKQSVAAGTEVERGTAIEVSISLGPKSFRVANVIGMTEEEAKIELLKQGIIYDNIKLISVYDTEKKPGVVLEQSPAFGENITPDSVIEISINDYTGKDTDENEVYPMEILKKDKIFHNPGPVVPFEKPNTVHERVAYQRRGKSLSQAYMSKALGINRTTYSLKEKHGGFTCEQIIEIAKIINVHPGLLFVGGDIPVKVVSANDDLTKGERGIIALFRSCNREKKQEIFDAVMKISRE